LSLITSTNTTPHPPKRQVTPNQTPVRDGPTKNTCPAVSTSSFVMPVTLQGCSFAICTFQRRVAASLRWVTCPRRCKAVPSFCQTKLRVPPPFFLLISDLAPFFSPAPPYFFSRGMPHCFPGRFLFFLSERRQPMVFRPTTTVWSWVSMQKGPRSPPPRSYLFFFCFPQRDLKHMVALAHFRGHASPGINSALLLFSAWLSSPFFL